MTYALIIEDQSTLAEEMASAIRHIYPQYRTHIVATVHRAVEWMTNHNKASVKLVILDRHLQNRLIGSSGEGLDGINIIRNHPAIDQHAKIIIWTSQTEIDSIQLAYERGADAFLSKDHLSDCSHDLIADLRSVINAPQWVVV